jgi:hypothetical protein
MLLDHGAAIRRIHEELARAACVPSCLGGGSTPDAVYRTIRSGDGGEDAYTAGVCGCRLQHAASWCTSGWVGYSICS